jgi:hypothetical protein
MPSLMNPIILATGGVAGGLFLASQALVSLISAQTSSQWLYRGYADAGNAPDGRVAEDLNY